MKKTPTIFKRNPDAMSEILPEPHSDCGWVPVDMDSKEDQRHKEAYQANMSDGTYELLGPKVQGNPEGFDKCILLKHSDAEQYPVAPRTFEALKEWMQSRDIEGLVYHHPDGRMAKIKKRDFGQKR